MLETIIKCASFCLVYTIVSLLIAFAKKREKKTSNMVCYPKFYFIVGIVAFVIFFVPTIVTAVLGLHILLPIGFFAFSLLSVVLIVACVNCKIFYDEDTITIQTFFAKKHTYSYSQITGYHDNSLGYYLYFGKKRRSIEYNALGQEEFLCFCRAKYRELHNAPIPYK